MKLKTILSFILFFSPLEIWADLNFESEFSIMRDDVAFYKDIFYEFEISILGEHEIKEKSQIIIDIETEWKKDQLSFKLYDFYLEHSYKNYKLGLGVLFPSFSYFDDDFFIYKVLGLFESQFHLGVKGEIGFGDFFMIESAFMNNYENFSDHSLFFQTLYSTENYGLNLTYLRKETSKQFEIRALESLSFGAHLSFKDILGTGFGFGIKSEAFFIQELASELPNIKSFHVIPELFFKKLNLKSLISRTCHLSFTCKNPYTQILSEFEYEIFDSFTLAYEFLLETDSQVEKEKEHSFKIVYKF